MSITEAKELKQQARALLSCWVAANIKLLESIDSRLLAYYQHLVNHSSIGDERVNGIPYAEIVETAREYIKALGGFERFAEWGLIR